MKTHSHIRTISRLGSLRLPGLALVFALLLNAGPIRLSAADAPARPTLKELKPVMEKAAADVFGEFGKVNLAKVEVIEIGASGWAPITGPGKEDVFWPVKVKCTPAAAKGEGEPGVFLFRVYRAGTDWKADTTEVYTETTIRGVFKSRQNARKQACIVNLRQIDGAKAMWALENRKGDTDTPRMADLAGEYLKATLTCPDGGSYSLNSMNKPPTCSIPGHELP